jgi:hypothetical protein
MFLETALNVCDEHASSHDIWPSRFRSLGPTPAVK